MWQVMRGVIFPSLFLLSSVKSRWADCLKVRPSILEGMKYGRKKV